MTTTDYETRVRALEAQGATRSDAQAVVDAEDMRPRACFACACCFQENSWAINRTEHSTTSQGKNGIFELTENECAYLVIFCGHCGTELDPDSPTYDAILALEQKDMQS